MTGLVICYTAELLIQSMLMEKFADNFFFFFFAVQANKVLYLCTDLTTDFCEELFNFVISMSKQQNNRRTNHNYMNSKTENRSTWQSLLRLNSHLGKNSLHRIPN